jgi:CRP-like cAMP-binding protein
VFYLVRRGWLIRYKILHDGRRQIVDFVLPGEVFGLQSCLFSRALYSVSTISEASVSAIRIRAIDAIFEPSNQTPKLSQALFWAALSEAAILGEHLVDAGPRTAYQRIGHLLLELFVRLKRGGMTDGASYRMPLTRSTLVMRLA